MERTPKELDAIQRDTENAGFTMPSDSQTGALLRVLAASRRLGRLLELGTGTGLSAAWLLDGMDQDSTLDSVDTDLEVMAIARRHLGHDARLTLHHQEGAAFLAGAQAESYDLIFADAWPGKYSHLDLALAALKSGGLYVVDDMLPQPNWPEGHQARVDALVCVLESRSDLCVATLNWSTGLIVATKIACAE